MGAQNSWYDYIAPDALLPSAGWLLAAFVALYSLWVAKNDMKIGMVVLAILAAGVTVWYSIDSVKKLRSDREVETNIRTLLALSGLPAASVNQGLDQLISRNLQPRKIIPTQEEVLANQFEFLKGEIPKRFAVTVLTIPTDDSYGIQASILRAFARNGIIVPGDTQSASTPHETGIMFTMPNPNDPPDFALKLRDAFGMAGIRDIRFVGMSPDVAARYDFTIFVGPAPLNPKK
jgi:hypothetical protein